MRRFGVLLGTIFLGCASPGELAFTTNSIDFGLSLASLEHTRLSEVINRGGSTIVLSEPRSTDPAFSIAFPARMKVAPGGGRPVTVHYVPRLGATEPDEATIELSTEEGLTATLRVTGTPHTPNCEFPDVLDFGPVELNGRRSLDIAIDPDISTVGSIESLYGDEFILERNDTAVTVTFLPTEPWEYASQVRMRRHPFCTDRLVRLIGTGVGTAVSWTPPNTDFGAVTIGTTACQSVTFGNLLFRPLSLTQVAVREGSLASGVFSASATTLVVPAATRDATQAVVAGTAFLEVCCNPLVAGPRAGQLTAQANVSLPASISVNLRCDGMQ